MIRVQKRDTHALWFRHLPQSLVRHFDPLAPEQTIQVFVNGQSTTWARMRPSPTGPTPGLKIVAGLPVWEKIELGDDFEISLDNFDYGISNTGDDADAPGQTVVSALDDVVATSGGIVAGDVLAGRSVAGDKTLREHGPRTGDWDLAEVTLVVDDYFAMLARDLQGEPYSKTEHRERLAPRLNGRSNGSIELKHQNISAVLVEMGLPYIDGYKPRGNYQALLGTAVEDHLARHPEFISAAATAKRLNPDETPVLRDAMVGAIFVPPPERIIVPKSPAQPWLSRRGRRIDFARRDAENRRMGRLGEQFVVAVERRRLAEAGRDDLAQRVEWVAETCGDGLGFDVLSFDEVNGGEKFVEVKTTGLGKYFPFYVSANEVRCSEAVPERFHLYRLFDFSAEAKLFVLSGALSAACRLEPMMFRASL